MCLYDVVADMEAVKYCGRLDFYQQDRPPLDVLLKHRTKPIPVFSALGARGGPYTVLLIVTYLLLLG